MSKPHYGISWSPGRLTGLDFADDIVMLSDSHDSIQHMTDDLKSQLALTYFSFRVLKISSILAATSPTSMILKLTYEQD